MSNISEALPCPFCDSTNLELVCNGSAWYVQCNECDATGSSITDGMKKDTDMAISAWNRPYRMPPNTRNQRPV